MKLRMTGIHKMLTATRKTTVNLPTTMSSKSEAFLLINFQMSMVKIVDAELKMLVKLDIRAASITANIKPLAPKCELKAFKVLAEGNVNLPVGNSFRTNKT